MLLFEVMLVSGLELQLRVVFGSMALVQLLYVMMSMACVINEGHVVAWDVYHHLRTPWCLRPMLLLRPY